MWKPLRNSSRRWRVHPQDTKVLFALGNTASQLGLAGARAVLPPGAGAGARRLEAIVNLANLLRAIRQYDAAIALLEPALAREPQSPELISPWARLCGKRRFAAGQTPLRGRAGGPPNYAPAWPIWRTWSSDGRPRAARTLYDKAIKADPEKSPGTAESRRFALAER
jgi:tetratricopeptide (TPR) repeat protein